MEVLEKLIERIDRLLLKAELLLPSAVQRPDWNTAIAFRWRRRGSLGSLEEVTHPHRIRLEDLKAIDEQKALVDQNTRQFVDGYPANNVLLTGARGTGKSSMVKAVLNRYAGQGLRLIEVEKQDLMDLPEIVGLVAGAPFKFLLFCDDLSFDADEPGYKALKAVLDGSIATTSDNLLIYATSNRRHLMPEYMDENLQTKYRGEEIHPAETVEEKISLSERFGLWISFYPFDQNEYLNIVRHWLTELGVEDIDHGAMRNEALQWALTRGSRSGRVAWHFARDWAGRHRIRASQAPR